MSDFKHPLLQEIFGAYKKMNAGQFETPIQRFESEDSAKAQNPSVIKKLRGENEALRAKLEKAEARVAELEEWAI